jgi:hypothetical protein
MMKLVAWKFLNFFVEIFKLLSLKYIYIYIYNKSIVVRIHKIKMDEETKQELQPQFSWQAWQPISHILPSEQALCQLYLFGIGSGSMA